jgi:hypothetical protein
MSYATSIKGVGIKKNGGVEVIEDLELPFPEVQPSEMLVKVIDHLLVEHNMHNTSSRSPHGDSGTIRRGQLPRHLPEV